MRNKVVIISLAALMLLVAAGCGCKKKESDDNKDKVADITANTNENVIKETEVEGLLVNNVSLVTENGAGSFNATVTNNSGAAKSVKYVKAHVKATDGSTIITLYGYIGETIENSQSKTISASCDRDLSTAASIEYEVVAQ